ncbi:MAG: PcfJ domain-containing protein [Oceanisphaera sp.]
MSQLSQHAVVTQEGDFVVQLTSPIQAHFRYRSWAAGFGCERWEAGHWCPEELDFALPLLAAAATLPTDDPIVRFVAGIPAVIRERVAPYTYKQTLLLRWLARSQPALELFTHSAQLCWLLVCFSDEQQWSEETTAALLTRSRVEILQVIAGVGHKALVKALGRVQLDKGDYQELLVLRDFLGQPSWLERVKHQSCINIYALCAYRKFPLLLNSAWLHQYDYSDVTSSTQLHMALCEAYRYWQDALNMAALLEMADGHIALARCASFDDIKALHDRWVDRLNQSSHLIRQGSTLFPAPPLAGNEHIFPITSAEDLFEEGRLMHHCVGSYVRSVQAGECYIYRVLSPERATIEVRWLNGKPDIAQVSLAYNDRPSEQTRLAIRNWLIQVTDMDGAPASGLLLNSA